MKLRFLAGPAFALVLMASLVAGTIAQDATPVAPDASSPIASPVVAAEVVPVDFFTVDRGDCARPTGTAAHTLGGDGYQNAGAGTLAPWGGGAEPNGTLGAIPVQYGEGVLEDLNLGQLLGGRATAVVVRNGSTGEIMACGEIGGVVQKADNFWQHDRLLIGLRAIGDSGVSGIATFTEDTGLRSDKIRISVALVSTGTWSAYPEATPVLP